MSRRPILPVLLVIALLALGRRLPAQTTGGWVFMAVLDSADTVYAMRSTHRTAPPRTRVWMRRVIGSTEGSVDAVMEFALDCGEGTVAMLSRNVQLTPASGGGPRVARDVPPSPEDRQPKDPTPGSVEFMAFTKGCAWMQDDASLARSPAVRGAPGGRANSTWSAIPIAESQEDTMYVDSADAHHVGSSPRLLSVWVEFTAHSDSFVVDGRRASYVLSEFHVECKPFKAATIQVLAFDDNDAFLGASDTPRAGLHLTGEDTREWAAAALACIAVIRRESGPH